MHRGFESGSVLCPQRLGLDLCYIAFVLHVESCLFPHDGRPKNFGWTWTSNTVLS